MLPGYAYSKAFDPNVRRVLDRINYLWATLSSFFFFKVRIPPRCCPPRAQADVESIGNGDTGE